MRAASAYIALQELYDVRGGRVGIPLQQANAAHNHSRSAVSALESARVQKCLLHRMQTAIFLKTFDRGDGLGRCRTDGDLTRPAGCAADQDRASTALPFSATVLAARQAEFVTKDKQERCCGIVVDRIPLAIHFEFDRFRHNAPRTRDSASAVAVKHHTSMRRPYQYE